MSQNPVVDERQRTARYALLVAPLIAIAIVALAEAGSVSTPNVFVPGEIADANAVNANFQALEDAVNDNAADTASLQTKEFVFEMQTTDASLVSMSFDGAVATFANTIPVEAGKVYQVRADVIARAAGALALTTDVVAWEIVGYTIVGSSFVSNGSHPAVMRASDPALTWSASVRVVTDFPGGNFGLTLGVRGDAGRTIDWRARVRFLEIGP